MNTQAQLQYIYMDGPFVFFLFDGQERRESDWLKDWENCSSFCRRLRLTTFVVRSCYISGTRITWYYTWIHLEYSMHYPDHFPSCHWFCSSMLRTKGCWENQGQAGASQENNWLIYIDADWSVSEQQRAPSCLDMSQFLTKVFPMYFLFFFCSSINIGIDEYRFMIRQSGRAAAQQ